MATAGLKIPEINWDATDLGNELAKFKQYYERRNQATRCRFRDNGKSDERLIEQLIVGTKHKKLQERLLERGEQLTLDEAIDIARTYEATQSQMEELDGESNKDIHGIKGDENESKN